MPTMLTSSSSLTSLNTIAAAEASIVMPSAAFSLTSLAAAAAFVPTTTSTTTMAFVAPPVVVQSPRLTTTRHHDRTPLPYPVTYLQETILSADSISVPSVVEEWDQQLEGGVLKTQRPDFVPSNKSLRYQLGCREEKEGLSSIARPAVVGHRGALYDCLENTREAFVHCAELGCDAVELDVFSLKDGTVVVFHGGGTDECPGDLSDYCLGAQGKSILDLDYVETQGLEFNPANPEFPCPPSKILSGRIPTLEQVLTDLNPYDIEVKIELKGPGVVQPVLEVVEKLQMQQQCSYSSFDMGRLQELRELRPDKQLYPSGALFTVPPEDFLHLAELVGATEIHLQYDQCSVDRIADIRNAGFKSMAWFRGPVGMTSDASFKYWDMGNEDAACYQAVIDTGVEQLCCNKPEVLLELLKQQQQQQQQQVEEEQAPVLVAEQEGVAL